MTLIFKLFICTCIFIHSNLYWHILFCLTTIKWIEFPVYKRLKCTNSTDMFINQIINNDITINYNLTIQEGACAMYLNNKFFEHDISKVGDDNNVEVTFPTNDNIVKVNVQKTTSYFNINGIPASRSQFSIQNAFALTVHKS